MNMYRIGPCMIYRKRYVPKWISLCTELDHVLESSVDWSLYINIKKDLVPKWISCTEKDMYRKKLYRNWIVPKTKCTELDYTPVDELLVSDGVCFWRETTTKCMTRSLNITPKTTEQHLIVRSGKWSEAKITIVGLTDCARVYIHCWSCELLNGHKAYRAVSLQQQSYLFTHNSSALQTDSLRRAISTAERLLCKLALANNAKLFSSTLVGCVAQWSLTGELSLSCARPAADGWLLMWVNRPL